MTWCIMVFSLSLLIIVIQFLLSFFEYLYEQKHPTETLISNSFKLLIWNFLMTISIFISRKVIAEIFNNLFEHMDELFSEN